MRKWGIILLCACFLIIPLSKGKSEENKNLDGYAWSRMNTSQRQGFVIGWILGGDAAAGGIFRALSLCTPISQEYKFEEFRENAQESAKFILNLGIESGIELNGVGIAQIISAIDLVYSDPRVKQWEIDKIMPIVRGRLKGGWTERQVDEVIAHYIRHNELDRKFNRDPRRFESNEYVELNRSTPKVILDFESCNNIEIILRRRPALIPR